MAYTVAGLHLDKAVEWGGSAGYGGALDKAVDAGAYGCSGELLLKIKLELRVNDLVLQVLLCLLCLLCLRLRLCVCVRVSLCVWTERGRERELL